MKNARSLALFSALLLTVGSGGAAKAQTTPTQQPQTPQQSEQSREQDRSRAEDVKIGRDWKAEGGVNDHTNQATPNDSHQTVGRDWRARPEDQDRK